MTTVHPLFTHYSRTVTTTTNVTFLPSSMLTPVGDPLSYKRRPMHNVERVRNLSNSLARCSWYCSSSSSRAQYNQGRSRVLRVRAARTWVNCLRVPLDLLFVLPPPPYRNVEGAPVP